MSENKILRQNNEQIYCDCWTPSYCTKHKKKEMRYAVWRLITQMVIALGANLD